MKSKKGVMNQIIGVFILVLVISVLAGMTFLFTSQLKTQVSSIAGATSTAYKAVNDTENAGANIISYLPLVFLALIFGVILVVVLRVILPYMNVTRGMDGI